MWHTDNFEHDKVQKAAHSVRVASPYRAPTLSCVLDMVVFEVQSQSREEGSLDFATWKSILRSLCTKASLAYWRMEEDRWVQATLGPTLRLACTLQLCHPPTVSHMSKPRGTALFRVTSHKLVWQPIVKEHTYPLMSMEDQFLGPAMYQNLWMPEPMDARTSGCFYQASRKELIERVYIKTGLHDPVWVVQQ